MQYVQTLGVSEKWQFVDVWGFESDLLQLLPRPICAVLLLYPLSDKVFSVFSLFSVRYLTFFLRVCLCMICKCASMFWYSLFFICFIWCVVILGLYFTCLKRQPAELKINYIRVIVIFNCFESVTEVSWSTVNFSIAVTTSFWKMEHRYTNRRLMSTVKVKVPILVIKHEGQSWSRAQGSQPAGDSMHSHEPGGGLPPLSTRPKATHMHSHEPTSRLSILSARPAVTIPAVGRHRP